MTTTKKIALHTTSILLSIVGVAIFVRFLIMTDSRLALILMVFSVMRTVQKTFQLAIAILEGFEEVE